MASAQEAGQVTFIARRVDGNTKEVMKAHVSILAGGGGAADGALASVDTPDQRLFAPESGPMMRADDVLQVQFTAEGADGIDVSDSIWQIPVTEYDSNGRRIGVKWLSRGDFTNPTPADYTTVANIPVTVGGYTVTEKGLKFGGGVIYTDFQDDTA